MGRVVLGNSFDEFLRTISSLAKADDVLFERERGTRVATYAVAQQIHRRWGRQIYTPGFMFTFLTEAYKGGTVDEEQAAKTIKIDSSTDEGDVLFAVRRRLESSRSVLTADLSGIPVIRDEANAVLNAYRIQAEELKLRVTLGDFELSNPWGAEQYVEAAVANTNVRFSLGRLTVLPTGL